MMPSLPEIDSNGLSHVGPVREDNQDSIVLPREDAQAAVGLFYGIADGMGGYSNGGLASQVALNAMQKTLWEESHLSPLKALRRGVEASNLGVYQAARRIGQGVMGTTLTAAVVSGDRLYLAHVGDSRAYLIRGGQAVCLTNDHTTVGDLVRMKVLSPDQVRTHARRSILTRCIGLSLFVQPDLIQLKVQDGDCLILCSDGAWSVIQDEEFGRLAEQSPTAQELNQQIIDLALQRETDDNASVISIWFQRVVPAPARSRIWRGWPLASLFRAIGPRSEGNRR